MYCGCHRIIQAHHSVPLDRPPPPHMAILQAKALILHKGSSEPGLMQELRMATDIKFRAMKVAVRVLGQTMSIFTVQERHLWLNLAELRDVIRMHFLEAPISQGGLFDNNVEDFAQQFSAVQKLTEAIKQTSCPGGTSLPSGCCGLRPPFCLLPRVSPCGF